MLFVMLALYAFVLIKFWAKKKVRYFLITFLFLFGISVIWFLTLLDRTLNSISKLIADKEVSVIYLSIEESKSEDLEIPLVFYWDNNKFELLGKFQKTVIINTVQNGGFPFVKKKGVLYLIARKFKNSSAGIAWDMSGAGIVNDDKRMTFKPIGKNRYVWDLNLQQENDRPAGSR